MDGKSVYGSHGDWLQGFRLLVLKERTQGPTVWVFAVSVVSHTDEWTRLSVSRYGYRKIGRASLYI